MANNNDLSRTAPFPIYTRTAANNNDQFESKEQSQSNQRNLPPIKPSAAARAFLKTLPPLKHQSSLPTDLQQYSIEQKESTIPINSVNIQSPISTIADARTRAINGNNKSLTNNNNNNNTNIILTPKPADFTHSFHIQQSPTVDPIKSEQYSKSIRHQAELDHLEQFIQLQRKPTGNNTIIPSKTQSTAAVAPFTPDNNAAAANNNNNNNGSMTAAPFRWGSTVQFRSTDIDPATGALVGPNNNNTTKSNINNNNKSASSVPRLPLDIHSSWHLSLIFQCKWDNYIPITILIFILQIISLIFNSTQYDTIQSINIIKDLFNAGLAFNIIIIILNIYIIIVLLQGRIIIEYSLKFIQFLLLLFNLISFLLYIPAELLLFNTNLKVGLSMEIISLTILLYINYYLLFNYTINQGGLNNNNNHSNINSTVINPRQGQTELNYYQYLNNNLTVEKQELINKLNDLSIVNNQNQTKSQSALAAKDQQITELLLNYGELQDKYNLIINQSNTDKSKSQLALVEYIQLRKTLSESTANYSAQLQLIQSENIELKKSITAIQAELLVKQKELSELKRNTIDINNVQSESLKLLSQAESTANKLKLVEKELQLYRDEYALIERENAADSNSNSSATGSIIELNSCCLIWKTKLNHYKLQYSIETNKTIQSLKNQLIALKSASGQSNKLNQHIADIRSELAEVDQLSQSSQQHLNSKKKPLF